MKRLYLVYDEIMMDAMVQISSIRSTLVVDTVDVSMLYHVLVVPPSYLTFIV